MIVFAKSNQETFGNKIPAQKQRKLLHWRSDKPKNGNDEQQLTPPSYRILKTHPAKWPDTLHFLELSDFTSNVIQDTVFTYLKQERQCLFYYRLSMTVNKPENRQIGNTFLNQQTMEMLFLLSKVALDSVIGLSKQKSFKSQ